MARPTLLAGDMGGTKTLLALYSQEGQGLRQRHRQRFSSADWPSLEPMLERFLQERPADVAPPSHGCIAVAGPVRHGSARITNLPWLLEEEGLARAAAIEQLELVNDFGVLIYGLPHLSDAQQVVLQPGGQDDGPLAILGAGTGLGMARGLRTEQGLQALPSEGGHREFAPRNQQEWDLACWLKRDLQVERLSIERIVSGTGLGHVANWLLQTAEVPAHPLRSLAETWRQDPTVDLPAAASKAADAGDPLMQRARELWLGAYGAAAGDLALQELCSGGLWIGGGTAAKQIEGLQSDEFLEPMRSKGRFRSLIEGLRVTAVVDPEAGLFSAACRARMLAESSGRLA